MEEQIFDCQWDCRKVTKDGCAHHNLVYSGDAAHVFKLTQWEQDTSTACQFLEYCSLLLVEASNVKDEEE